MNRTKYFNFWILPFCFLVILYGCAGPTRAVIPDQIQPVSDEKARIVVTREKQIAGMTTPIYIVDASDTIDPNATMKTRVGEWRKTTTPQLLFFNTLGFVVLPTPGTTFAETGKTMDDLITRNMDAIVYIDYLRCDPDKVNFVYCGNGKKECDESFKKQLVTDEGMIIGDIQDRQSVEEKDNSKSVRDIQVIGKFYVGNTLVWDRKPGIMRVGALWGSSSKSEHILNLTPVNIKVQPGKTYYLHYTTNLGERWKITKVE